MVYVVLLGRILAIWNYCEKLTTDESYRIRSVRANDVIEFSRYLPNDITPIAWNTPSLTVNNGLLKLPLFSAGTVKPWVTTVRMMTSMLMSARALAFANYHPDCQPRSPRMCACSRYLCNVPI